MLASRTRGIRAAQSGRGHDYGVLRGVIAVSGVMVFLTLGVLALVADLDLLLFIAVFVCLLGLFFGVDAVDRQIPSELRRSPLGFYRRPHAH